MIKCTAGEDDDALFGYVTHQIAFISRFCFSRPTKSADCVEVLFIPLCVLFYLLNCYLKKCTGGTGVGGLYWDIQCR